MGNKDYNVVSKVTHDGKDYQPGETITLDEEMAAPALAGGALEPRSKAKPAARNEAAEG